MGHLYIKCESYLKHLKMIGEVTCCCVRGVCWVRAETGPASPLLCAVAGPAYLVVRARGFCEASARWGGDSVHLVVSRTLVDSGMKQVDHKFKVNKEDVSFDHQEFVEMLQKSCRAIERCFVCGCQKKLSLPSCKCDQCKCCKHMYHKPARRWRIDIITYRKKRTGI